MQFTRYFYRYSESPTGLASGGIAATVALGADTDPRTPLGVNGVLPAAPTPAQKSAANVDNVMSVPGTSKNGFPQQRVAVALIGPTGLSGPINASLYTYDSQNAHWLLLTPTQMALYQNQVGYFDAFSPLDPPQSAGYPNQQSAGGVDYMLVAQGVTGVPTGVYQFGMTVTLVNSP